MLDLRQRQSSTILILRLGFVPFGHAALHRSLSDHADDRLAALADILKSVFWEIGRAGDSTVEWVEQLHDALDALVAGDDIAGIVDVVALENGACVEEEALEELIYVLRRQPAEQDADVAELGVAYVEGRLVLEIDSVVSVIRQDDLDQVPAVCGWWLLWRCRVLTLGDVGHGQMIQPPRRVRNTKYYPVDDLLQSEGGWAAALGELAAHVGPVKSVQYFGKLPLIRLLGHDTHGKLQEVATCWDLLLQNAINLSLNVCLLWIDLSNLLFIEWCRSVLVEASLLL